MFYTLISVTFLGKKKKVHRDPKNTDIKWMTSYYRAYRHPVVFTGVSKLRHEVSNNRALIRNKQYFNMISLNASISFHLYFMVIFQ